MTAARQQASWRRNGESINSKKNSCMDDLLMQEYFYNYILSISAKTTACWSAVNLDKRANSFCWESVREAGASPSANNWDSIMPHAAQIFSSDGIVGTMFLRYHEEIVDWGRPERSASWYSVHPLASRYSVMVARISFTTITPLLVFFVNYTLTNRCSIFVIRQMCS